MLKFDSTINEDSLNNFIARLNIGDIDLSVLNETAGYFLTVMKMLDGIRKAYHIWLEDTDTDVGKVETKDFLSASLSMFKLFKKAITRADGIVELYLTRLIIPDIPVESRNYQVWCYSGQSEVYSQVKGIFSHLINSGLSHELIDKYYLDGSLLELYECCLDIETPLKSLLETENPNPMEVKEGIFIIEDRIRILYNKLFVEEFEDLQGISGVIKFALEEMK